MLSTTVILSTILSDQSEPLTIKSRGPVLAINFFITHKVRVSSPASLCSQENSILNNSRMTPKKKGSAIIQGVYSNNQLSPFIFTMLFSSLRLTPSFTPSFSITERTGLLQREGEEAIEEGEVDREDLMDEEVTAGSIFDFGGRIT